MGEHLITSVVTVLTAVIALAIIASLVSKRANTAGVLTSGGNAFSGILQAAEAPVTGFSGGYSNYGGASEISIS